MGEFWSTALPNWIMALTGVAALIFGVAGALVAWRSLQQQIRESQRADEAELAAKARDVTAQWVWRDRRFPDRAEPVREWGLRVMNHGRVTVYNVVADVEVGGAAEQLPELHTLHPGDMFVQRLTRPEGGSRFLVKRMKEDVCKVEAILKPDWVVRSVSFESEGERLTWRPRDRASRG